MLAGCGEDLEITDQVLTGEIGGASWTFVEGDTNAFLSDDDFFATLYAEDFDQCNSSPSAVNHLILNIPKETGEWGLSLSRNMTFVVQTADGVDNLIGTEGTLRVDQVTADEVVGGIHAKFDGSNQVDGTFTIEICE
jgi:hypothetical protein